MSYTLFLDDERDPTPDLVSLRVARNIEEAKQIISTYGVPHTISFDHDLGSTNGVLNKTGYDLSHWLINEHLDRVLDLCSLKKIIVHSRNEVGAKNIESLWRSFNLVLRQDLQIIRRPRNSLND